MGLNNVLPNAHFRKHWQRYVRTWFDQPGKKKSRRIARLKKAARIAPRPVDGLLRPVVRGQTLKYNMRVRAGRGFTLDELKQAGIRKKEARSIGIAVDHRRKNRSEEGFNMNVERLKEYKSKLVLLPKNSRKQRAQRKGFKFPEGIQTTGMVLPITQSKPSEMEGTITPSTGPSAFSTLRNARAEARLVGVRVKRMKIAAANV